MSGCRSHNQNKDIDFENLFNRVDRRIDASFCVGNHENIDDTATYANAQVSKQVFAENVDPNLRSYTQLTHELNRITGSMGIVCPQFAIPQVIEEVKVRAEADDFGLTAS